MTSDDEYGFWEDGRERSHIPGASVVDRISRRADREWTNRPARSHRPARRAAQPNPLMRRLGALCAIGLIALAVAYVVRGSDPTQKIDSASAAAPAALGGADFAAGAVPADQAALGAVVPAAPVAVAPAPVAPDPAAVDIAPVDAAVPAVQQPSIGVVEAADSKRSCATSYTLRAGDYWIALARRGGVKLADLLQANGATTNTPLYPGHTLCLPAGTVMAAASTPTTETTTVTTTAMTTATTAKSTPTSTAKTTPTTVKTTPTTVKAASTPTPSTAKPKSTATTAAPTTTVAPTTTTEPRPKNNYTREQVEQIIRAVWPDDLEDEAVRIATRESNLNPTVRNSCCYGLFQIYFNANRASLMSWGVTSASALYDPQVNAFVAYAMYLRAGGWGPWAM